MLVIMGYIIFSQLHLIKTEKSQNIALMPVDQFKLNINDHFPLIGFSSFYVDKLISKIRKVQTDAIDKEIYNYIKVTDLNMEELSDIASAMRVEKYAKRLPENFSAFSPEEKKYLEEFMCNNTKVEYRESETYEMVGIDPYSL